MRLREREKDFTRPLQLESFIIQKKKKKRTTSLPIHFTLTLTLHPLLSL